MINVRLIVAIVTTFLDDILILLLLMIGLPYVGVYLPLILVAGIALLWVAIAVFLYLMGSRVLRKKPLTGFTNMVDMQGIAIRNIAPQGMVKIKGELWMVKSKVETIAKGERIIVTGQNNMELTVKKYIEPGN